MDQIRICIVEGQLLIRQSLQILLNIEADFVIVASVDNCRDAIKLCHDFQPDIVLMDIHIPGMNGVEATKILYEQFPSCKVIILATFEDNQYIVSAIQAGAEGYLLKALDPQYLSSSIRLIHKGKTMISQKQAMEFLISPLSYLQTDEKTTPIFAPKGNKKLYFFDEHETQILQLIADGIQSRSIAETLYISEVMVKHYISKIYSKMQLCNHTAKTI